MTEKKKQKSLAHKIFVENIEIKNLDVKEFYNIEIRDNGCGIGEEAKKKIFMPNFTTKSSGMGVGLSIVYDILETLNSDISFESEVGVGTIFRININNIRHLFFLWC